MPLLDRDHINFINPLAYGYFCTDTTLNAAVTAISSNLCTLFITKTDRGKTAASWVLAASVTFPSTMTVWIPAGTVLSANSGVTVTFNGPVRLDDPTSLQGAGTFLFNQAQQNDNSLGSYITSGFSFTVPSSSLTFAAVGGSAVNTVGEFRPKVNQAAVAVGPLGSGNGLYWLIVDYSASRFLSGWIRQSTTHYLWQLSASQPAIPAGAQLIAKVTVAGSVITAVADYRTPFSYIRSKVYDVTDPLYGSDPLGVADATTAFNLAINASYNNGGGSVYVPKTAAGFYINGAVNIQPGTYLHGDSHSLITHGTSAIYNIISDKITISDIEFNTPTILTSQALFLLGGGNDFISIKNNRFITPAGVGGKSYIVGNVTGVQDVYICDNFMSYGTIGILLNSFVSGTRLNISRNTIIFMTAESVNINTDNATFDHVLISNNLFQQNTAIPSADANCVTVAGALDISILNNDILDFANDGIHLDLGVTQDTSRVIIQGNNIRSSYAEMRSCVSILAPSGEMIISGNILYHASGTGLTGSQSTALWAITDPGGTIQSVTMTNNRIVGPFVNGIIAGLLTQEISGNTFDGSTNGIIIVGANNGNIHDNVFNSVTNIYTCASSCAIGNTIINGTAPTAIITTTAGVSSVRGLRQIFSLVHPGGAPAYASAFPAPTLYLGDFSLQFQSANFVEQARQLAHGSATGGTWTNSAALTLISGTHLSTPVVDISGGVIRAGVTDTTAETLVGILDLAGYYIK